MVHVILVFCQCTWGKNHLKLICLSSKKEDLFIRKHKIHQLLQILIIVLEKAIKLL